VICSSACTAGPIVADVTCRSEVGPQPSGARLPKHARQWRWVRIAQIAWDAQRTTVVDSPDICIHAMEGVYQQLAQGVRGLDHPERCARAPPPRTLIINRRAAPGNS